MDGDKKMTRLDNAMFFVIDMFRGETDKLGTSPKSFHSLKVMMSLDTEPERVVGALHDIPEDLGISIKFLTDAFKLSEYEAEALTLLTHKKGERYLDYIANIGKSGNSIAINVKYADIKHNSSEKRLKGLPKDTYDRLVKKYLGARAILDAYNMK
jgi:hypothetical protein